MKFILILLASIQFAVASENTLHEASIYKTPGGAEIARLKAGMPTEAANEVTNGFSKITLQVDNPSGGDHLNAHETLKVKGFEVGSSTQAIPFDFTDESAKSGGIYAYIKTSDIDPATIPERVLEKKLANPKNRTRSALLPTLQHFNFVDSKFSKKFESQMIETNLGGHLTTEPRLYVIFQKEKLAGIIHLYDLKVSGGTDYAVANPYHLTWFMKNEKDRSELTTTFDKMIRSGN